jgi:hypothetical protein
MEQEFDKRNIFAKAAIAMKLSKKDAILRRK